MAALVVIIAVILKVAWIFYRRKSRNENRQDIGNIQNAAYMGDTQTRSRASQVQYSEGGYEEPSDYAQLDILKRIPIDENYQSLTPSDYAQLDSSKRVPVDVNYQSLIHKDTQGGSTNTSLMNESNTGDDCVTVISTNQVAKESIYEELS